MESVRRELLRVGSLSARVFRFRGSWRPPRLALRRAESSRIRRSDGPRTSFTSGCRGAAAARDVRPQARRAGEIRGAFKPIQTNVPGIQFCELLPRIARIADKLAVVRSLHTDTDLHDASGYEVLTGYRYTGTNSRQISPTDWPYFGSVLKLLKPSEKLPPLTSVWLPDIMRLNENVTPAGQTGGFLGRQWDPGPLRSAILRDPIIKSRVCACTDRPPAAQPANLALGANREAFPHGLERPPGRHVRHVPGAGVRPVDFGPRAAGIRPEGGAGQGSRALHTDAMGTSASSWPGG